jgi:aminotransferase
MRDVISLGVGEPDFLTPWHIRDAGIYSLEKGFTKYTSNAGLRELRQEISCYLKRRFSLNYDPGKQILVTVGGSEAIDLSLRVLLNPATKSLFPCPRSSAMNRWFPCRAGYPSLFPPRRSMNSA